jgi:hypothetical protein
VKEKAPSPYGRRLGRGNQNKAFLLNYPTSPSPKGEHPLLNNRGAEGIKCLVIFADFFQQDARKLFRQK